MTADSNVGNANEPWGVPLYGNPCRDCNFDWDLSTSDAIVLVQQLPRIFAARLDDATGSEIHPDLAWSTGGYVCHVADNLRIWGERLVGARLTGDLHVPGYDQDLLGAAKHYNEINLQSALSSLDSAVQYWSTSILAALEEHTELDHATRGRQSADDVVRNTSHDAVHHLWDIERILALFE